LRLFRSADSPNSHAVRAKGHLYDATVAELTRVTLKADWLRQSGDESAILRLDVLDSLNEDPTIVAHDNGNYWVQGAHGYADTQIAVGVGGWETIEMVLTWRTSTSDKVSGTFDVFLSRDEGNSLGALSRTLIASGVAVNPIALATHMDIFISIQPGGVGDIVTYWDNVSLRVDPLLDGDFNGDGLVDSADYTVWRDALGSKYTTADYNLWKNNFGKSIATIEGFGADSSVVPEPAVAGLAVYGIALIEVYFRHRRRFRRISET
jgi:hypothetical protein